MARKLAVIAVTGIALSLVLVGTAAVIDGPKLAGSDWRGFRMAFSGCRPVSGATATRREFDWTGRDEIRIGVPGKAHYRRGEGDKVIVTGDPGMITHVEVEGGKIELDCGGFDHDGVDITLPGREFRSFRVSGAADLDAEGLDQDRIELDISGAGRIRASGRVRQAEVDVSGAGHAYLGRLAVEDVEMEVSGAGRGEIAPRERAVLEVSGAGKITLLTDPRMLDTRVSGAGRIDHRAGSTETDGI